MSIFDNTSPDEYLEWFNPKDYPKPNMPTEYKENPFITGILMFYCRLVKELKDEDPSLEMRIIVDNEEKKTDYKEFGVSKKALKEMVEEKKEYWIRRWMELDESVKDILNCPEIINIQCQIRGRIKDTIAKYDNMLFRLEGYNDVKIDGSVGIEELKKIPIGELIGGKGKKVGKNIMMRCPFHTDKTPSLSWNPEKNIFHCFSCGVGGSVIDYVMARDKCDCKEAIKILTAYHGRQAE